MPPDMMSPPVAGVEGEEAPFGASSATGPTPNKGYEAAGVQKIGVLIKQMTDILPMVGATSELGQAVMKAIQSFAKFVQPGAVTPTAERNVLEQGMIKNAQQSAMLQQLRQMAAQGGGGQPPQAGGPPAMPRAA